MSETTQAPVEQSTSTSGEVGTKDSVAYDTYRKVLAEAKSAKQRLAELESKEAERQTQLLQEQGKYKEALDAMTAKVKEYEGKLVNTEKTFGRKVFTQEAKAVAMQMGVIPSALDDVIKVGDWSTVEIGEDFSVNTDQLKEAIARMQKEKPHYFQKQVSNIKDVNQANGFAITAKKPSELSTDEIIKQLKQLG